MPVPRPSSTLDASTRAKAKADAEAARLAGPPVCGRCMEPKQTSTWGRYKGVYCDDCSGAMALERLGTRPKAKR